MSKRSLFLLVALVMMLSLGVTMTASAQSMMSVSAPDCDYGGQLQAIEAINAQTVKFILCYPDPAFPAKVAFTAFNIQSSEHLQLTGGGGELITKPVGTGPYRLERWEPGNELVLTRYDGYWGDAAKEATVIFRWHAEAAVRLAELQGGTIDGMDSPAESEFATIADDPNLQLYPHSGNNIFYLGLNNIFEPLNDVRVRQAIAYAIDRQRIVDSFYPPGSMAATQFMPPSIFGFTPEVDVLSFDPDRARTLLDEVGLEPDESGVRFTMTISYRDVVRGYLPTPGLVAADIQAQLAEVGIATEIVVMESGAFLDAADAGELPIYLLGWSAQYPDATNFLDVHFGSNASDQFGEKFPEIVELLEAAQLSDPAARLEIYAQANTAIRDLMPMVPIAHAGDSVAFAGDIVGAYAATIGVEKFALMEDPDDENIIWMQSAEPLSLYCADETEVQTLRVCEQIGESLLAFEPETGAIVASLATDWSTNDTLTEWTFTLRDGVTFHDGSTLDALDVVATYTAQWDLDNPLRVGRDGTFTYFASLFGGFIGGVQE